MKRSEREYIKKLAHMLDECDGVGCCGGDCGGGCCGDGGAMSTGAGEYCSLGEPGTGTPDVLGRCDHGGSKGFMGDGCFHVPFPTMPRLIRIPGNGGSLSKKKKNGKTVSVKNPYVKGMKTIIAETEAYDYQGSAKEEFDKIAAQEDNIYMGVLNYNKPWKLAWMIDSDGFQRYFKPALHDDSHEHGLHDNMWHITTSRLTPSGQIEFLERTKEGYASEQDALTAIYKAVQRHKELLNEFLKRMDESRYDPRDLIRWEASGRDPRYFPQPRKPEINQRALQAELKMKFHSQFDSAEISKTPAGTWRATFHVSRPGEDWREIRGQIRARQAIPMINQIMSFLRVRDVNVNQYDVLVVNDDFQVDEGLMNKALGLFGRRSSDSTLEDAIDNYVQFKQDSDRSGIPIYEFFLEVALDFRKAGAVKNVLNRIRGEFDPDDGGAELATWFSQLKDAVWTVLKSKIPEKVIQRTGDRYDTAAEGIAGALLDQIAENVYGITSWDYKEYQKRLKAEVNKAGLVTEKKTRKGAGINPDATPDELFDQLSEQNLEDYCQDLEFLLHADDSKATALYNKFKRGFKNAFDDVECKKSFVGIKNLRPTQDAIFLRNSIKPALDGQLTDDMRGGQPLVKSLLDPHDSQRIAMGSLVVCSVNGVNYIIDGHHRWSRAYMINPDAKMLAYVI